MSCLCSGNCFRRKLPAGVVDGVGRIEDQLTDGHNGIPVVDQAVEDGRQGLRRVQRSVVEQHDAPRPHLGCYAPAYRIRVVVLPVQGVHIGNELKPLRRKGLRVWQLCALAEKLTCKWGVWRTFQARERSKSRGRARGGWWLKDGGGCGILKVRYGDASLLNIALTWSKIPLLPWIIDAVAYLKKIKAI